MKSDRRVCAPDKEVQAMSRGRQRFRKREAERLLRAYGQATGLSPEDVCITAGPDGSLTVSARTNASNPQTNAAPLEAEKEIVL
jgi:hypothetical protein